MSDRIPPSGGMVIAGLFLFLFGIVLLLAGGACTVVWIFVLVDGGMRGSGLADALPMLAVSPATAGLGFLSLKGGLSSFRGKAPPAPRSIAPVEMETPPEE
jgi:hypothetical protein